MPRIKGTAKFWDYEKSLPECRYKHYDVGSTHLIRSADQNNVFLKLEIENPTKSFKDRGSIVEVGKALQYCKKEIAVASTGDMALVARLHPGAAAGARDLPALQAAGALSRFVPGGERSEPGGVAGRAALRRRGMFRVGGTGFRGRSAIHELLDLTDKIREMILDRRSTSEIERMAREEGMTFLRESAVAKIRAGVTTLREINKVTFIEGSGWRQNSPRRRGDAEIYAECKSRKASAQSSELGTRSGTRARRGRSFARLRGDCAG